MSIEIISDDVVASLPYLDLHAIRYRDKNGRMRQWDSASRKPGQPGAVIIVPIIHPQEEVLLVRQYRVPLKCQTIEFPAGLVDEGESLEKTVHRELYEETGYVCSIRKILPATASSAGLTSETVNIAFVDIDSNVPENEMPMPHPEASEDIYVLRIPSGELLAFLEEQARLGVCIDSKLMMFAASKS
ncbi:MAG: NUDIX hydrolase [Victivallales bacterium]|nr:NUDIX hydrolase [Victivallales bacterium]